MEKNCFKIVIIGESTVGKTSLITRYFKNQFDNISENDRTVNAYNIEKVITINENSIKLKIWDTAGEEKYHALTPMYYRDADGVILVFDLTKKETFSSLSKWLQEVQNNTNTDIKLIICGNKSDLTNNFAHEEAYKLGRSLNITYMGVSAKTGLNVSELFTTLAIRKKYNKDRDISFKE